MVMLDIGGCDGEEGRLLLISALEGEGVTV
jgi:hypothetical protein